MKHRLAVLIALGCTLLPAAAGLAADAPSFSRTEDVIYGRKFGVALTMDVFRPKEHANGVGIVWIVSGGWYSSHDIDGLVPGLAPVLQRGYTVFTVVHGSQPKFAIPEIVQDMNRAVRFIRFHAKDYGIDPDRLGVTGGSAGGHLSLMQGTAGDKGDPNAKDPVDRASSRVQAVACWFPPTDFLNYGKPGENAVGRGILADFAGAFDFHEYDNKLKKFVAVTDEKKVLEFGKAISPIYHVTADSPPTLIIHGDADHLVPIQQSETMIQKLKDAGVEAKLVVRPGGAHGWPDMGKEAVQIYDWFDAHLLKKPEKPAEAKP